jgi:hypothetical protein
VIVLAVRSFWPKVLEWWEQAKEGGQILAHPGAYFGRVFLPGVRRLGRGPLRRRDLPRGLCDPGHLSLRDDSDR